MSDPNGIPIVKNNSAAHKKLLAKIATGIAAFYNCSFKYDEKTDQMEFIGDEKCKPFVLKAIQKFLDEMGKNHG